MSRGRITGGGKIRHWMEGTRWYWLSVSFHFTLFPWHWTVEKTFYKWGVDVKFGPFGVLILWN